MGERAGQIGRRAGLSSPVQVLIIGLLLGFVLPGFPIAARAQVVRGRLLDSENEVPIVNGTVSLVDSLGAVVTRTLSNTEGEFRLVGRHPGRHTLRAQGMAYRGFPVPVILVEDSVVTADVYLRPMPIQLEPIVITSERVRSELERQGFFRRQELGHGFFLTPSQLKARPPITVASLIDRAPFVEIQRSWMGSRIQMRQRGRACDPSILIDNNPIPKGENIEDFVAASHIAALEVFRGYAEIPHELALGMENCGVVMIWTVWSELRSRRKGGGGTPLP